MKIVHVIECFAGGSFSFLSALTNELNNEEHIIIYGISRENTPQNFRRMFPKNTIFIEWEYAQRYVNPIKDLKALVELYKILKNIQDVDIIHLHSSKAGFLGRIVAFILRKQNRTIYTTHAISFLRLDISNKKKNFFIWMEKFANLFGGKIIACSKSEMEAIKDVGIKNVTYINNGIKPIENRSTKSNKDKFTIISVGRLSIQKNPQLFNEIALAFIDKKDIQFIWCGDGELRDKLISPNIKVTGWIDKESVISYLSNADIYLSTSLWEGLPLSVLEAMSMKKALILSNCVGNRDLIDSNGYLYVKKKDAVKYINILLKDRDKMIKFESRSKNIFNNKFTIKKMGEDYLLIYKNI